MGGWLSKPAPKPPEPTLPRPTWREARRDLPDTERVESMRESAECRAFRKCFSILADGILDPGRLAVELYTRGWIGADLRTEAQKPEISERVKIDKVLSVVEGQLRVSPMKFRELLDILQQEPSLKHLAARLERSYHAELKVYQHPVHQGDWQLNALNTYASYLKSVYTREKLPVYDKWPPVKPKKYINLGIITKNELPRQEAYQFMKDMIDGFIDKIKKSKRSMNIGQFVQLLNGSHPKCILVEEVPGVGKSTFAWKLCHKWGRGKLLQQYKLVVLLRLRDKSVRGARCVSDLFQYHDNQVQQAAVDEIQRTGGKGVLLLFEGYDELPEAMRTENSIFLDVITGRELPDATVLVTSRHWASEFLHRKCKRHISYVIEIVGFTSANIQSYIESTCSDDPKMLVGLKKYISFYPHIKSMMYVPLNCAIVVEVYRDSKKEDNLIPKTITELYSSLIRSLLLHYLCNHPEHGKNKWSVQCFNDLPPDVYEQLCRLSTIAYNGIVHEQQVIFSNLQENFETLGLMQCAPELYVDEGAAVSYNFLHLTIQESLAAFHLSQQPVEKQIEHFQIKHKNKRKRSHFQMVLRFLAGLRKFRGYSTETMSALCIEMKKCHDESGIKSGDVIHKMTSDVLHRLFETQESDTISDLLGFSLVHISDNALTLFDCFALGFCVSHSNCSWSISLPICHNGDQQVELLVRGAVEKETKCTGGITEIKFSSNLTNKGLNYLLKLPKHIICNLEVLSLGGNNLDSCAILALLVSHMPNLQKLDLLGNPFKQGETAGLITALRRHNLLSELSLPGISFGIKDSQGLRKVLSKTTTIKNLFIPSLSTETLEPIISGLQDNTSLEKLSMSYSDFSLQNSISLASVLRTNHSLVCLYITNSNIDLYHLAIGLCTNTTLQKLDLDLNTIDAKGAAKLALALRSNHTLLELNLENCNIDTCGACHLATAFHTNHTLQQLHLGYNMIGDEGASAFATALRKNHALVHLNLCHCNIGSNGAQLLASGLCTNDTLQTLYLDGYPIGDEGAVAFALLLQENSTLVHINLVNCNINSSGACQMATAICMNGTLQHLDLSQNPIGVKGAASFAEMLHQNKSLKALCLSDDTICEEGTQKLVDSLTENTTLHGESVALS